MVKRAQQVEVIEHREVGLGPVDAVITLQVCDAATPKDSTRWVEPLERGLLEGGWLSAEMRHPHQLAALGQNRCDEGVA